MAKGYSYAHRKRRAELLPYAYGTPCPLCGHEMHRGEALDLDHTVPLSLGGRGIGDRITHASCNRARGNGTLQRPRTSRRW